MFDVYKDHSQKCTDEYVNIRKYELYRQQMETQYRFKHHNLLREQPQPQQQQQQPSMASTPQPTANSITASLSVTSVPPNVTITQQQQHHQQPYTEKKSSNKKQCKENYSSTTNVYQSQQQYQQQHHYQYQNQSVYNLNVINKFKHSLKSYK